MATAQDTVFGEALKRYRLAAGLTQEELAERSQMSVRGLVYLERGERHPHRETVQRLADALALPDSARTTLEALARRLTSTFRLKTFRKLGGLSLHGWCRSSRLLRRCDAARVRPLK